MCGRFESEYAVDIFFLFHYFLLFLHMLDWLVGSSMLVVYLQFFFFVVFIFIRLLFFCLFIYSIDELHLNIMWNNFHF